jgi:hypothetical protein
MPATVATVLHTFSRYKSFHSLANEGERLKSPWIADGLFVSWDDVGLFVRRGTTFQKK